MRRLLRRLAIAVGIMALLGTVGLIGGYLWISSTLPPITKLTEYDPKVPLRIYTADGQLAGEFGRQRRLPLPPEAIPERLKDAFIAAEDASFFQHYGIDIRGIIRAVIADIRAGAFVQGASTITQQVARTFLLTRDRTIIRKLREMLLAFRIERNLTKEEILHLYLNQIYLGNGAYGVEAAAQSYYGKSASELTLAEMAMLAGLPKAPAGYNPTRNPEVARERRNYVLLRMNEQVMAPPEEIREALETPIHASDHDPVQAHMPVVAEEVRRRMVARYGEERTYTGGLEAFTSVDPELQRIAQEEVQDGLLEYTYRHGYRGPLAHRPLEEFENEQEATDYLRERGEVGPLRTALVLKVGPGPDAEPREPEEAKDGEEAPEPVSPGAVRVLFADGTRTEIPWDGLKWARPYKSATARGPKPQKPADILSAGDVIRVSQWSDHLALSQRPRVQGALVAMDPDTGRILAMVGGFDSSVSQYNRATQARRQPGSAFKPFIYATALRRGMTLADLINDAPIVFEDKALETRWRPENYSEKFYGPTRMRVGLEHSRNLVTIRLLNRIGVDPTVRLAAEFGFKPDRLPHDLSLALGSASLPPVQMVRGYATFANGGRQVDPILLDRVEGAAGEPVRRRISGTQCMQCHRVPVQEAPSSEALQRHPELAVHPNFRPERVLTPQENYLMTDLLQGVVENGTGWRAKRLERPLAGKTGTTNNQRDAWFIGFNRDLVVGVWVGFDKPQTLGRHETGSRAASPIWVDFMDRALGDRPTAELSRPPGLVSVRIDADTGKLAAPWSDKTLFELFREGNAPTQTTPKPSGSAGEQGQGDANGNGSGEKGSGEGQDSSGPMMDDLF
jgi:penicillin-binding protein 1A